MRLSSAERTRNAGHVDALGVEPLRDDAQHDLAAEVAVREEIDVRERELGTLEQLFVTPVSRTGLLAGKLVPYAALGFGEMCLVLVVMVYAFGVPIRGEPDNLGEEAPRRFLRILSKGEPAPFQNGSGRVELADVIASPENPRIQQVT